MTTEEPIFRPAPAVKPHLDLSLQGPMAISRMPSSRHYLSLAVKACRPSFILGCLLMLLALYVAWRAIVIWNEARLEKRRLKENRIWMREERKRRSSKIVGILSGERSDRASKREQMMKRVRFVEALGGMAGGADVAFDHALERRFGGGDGMC